MFNARMLFSVQGQACYISHLDKMKTIQRAMRRAGIPVKYSEGFNPHINLSILVPLSTGFSSNCELCDFTVSDEMSFEECEDALKTKLPDGLLAGEIYKPERPVSEIAFVKYSIFLKNGDINAMKELFSRPVIMEKQTKRSRREVDICEYIHEIVFIKIELVKSEKSDAIDTICCEAVLKYGPDQLNPMYVANALLEKGLTDRAQSVGVRRECFFDSELKIFR